MLTFYVRIYINLKEHKKLSNCWIPDELLRFNKLWLQITGKYISQWANSGKRSTTDTLKLWTNNWSLAHQMCFELLVFFTTAVQLMLSSSDFWIIFYRHTFQGNIRLEVFCKKGVIKNFAKFTGKLLCHTLF